MTNGKRIKYLREKNGLTQKDIATRLGVESAAISKYELDMREPNIEALKKLATIFNVSIDYLLGRTPDVFIDEYDKNIMDISIIKEKYELTKRKSEKIKEQYINEGSIITAKNEICTGAGITTYGESKSNATISILEIENIFNDFENSKDPKPQILIKITDLENSIIIIEIDSFDDEELPINAIDRIAIYTAKFAKKYNVLGLAMSVDKDKNCKLVDSIYQKQGDSYYTQLHLPKTVLTAVEYIDIMIRL